MKTATVFFVIALLAGGCVLAFLLLSHPEDHPAVRPATSADDGPDADGQPDVAGTPEEAAAQKMRALKSPSDRIEHLDWLAEQDWAKSSMGMLRTTIITDPDETVQIHAVETALKLAKREGDGATSAVVETSLASTKGNTRARGLKAARESPDPKLVPELIALVNERDAYATMALNALAYTDSEEAHAKILAIAEDDGADHKLRERAVALLAVTKDREAYGILHELANGQDEALSNVAKEVLKVLNIE